MRKLFLSHPELLGVPSHKASTRNIARQASDRLMEFDAAERKTWVDYPAEKANRYNKTALASQSIKSAQAETDIILLNLVKDSEARQLCLVFVFLLTVKTDFHTLL